MFQAHIELLQVFLAHREAIVEKIQGLLNAQRKPTDYQRDGIVLSRLFEDAFFAGGGVTSSMARLRGQLDVAHATDGFTPRDLPGLHNGLADPAEMMVRAFHLWQLTRWPGRNGRVRYAHTLFNVYMLRCLELVSMRLWDDGDGTPSQRLARIHSVLDQLWRTTPADQPVLIRDARWLIPLAQSPATDDLAPYFVVAQRIAETLPHDERLEIHRAGVLMAAGHLRSQIRYYATQTNASLAEPSVVLRTRNSNALDFALLIQDLVPLLDAYEQAVTGSDQQRRHQLADTICQGISPDPELFMNRVELLGAYSMIEHLFVTADGEGRAAYTATGQRHVQLIQDYTARIARVARPLCDDCSQLRPVAGTYSPFGVLFGFSSDLIEHMAFKTLQSDAMTQFGLEDVFAAGDGDKLAWVNGWRQLPHLSADVRKLFDYPQQFADDVFARLEQALRRRVTSDEARVSTGQLTIVASDRHGGEQLSSIPALPVRYISSSDKSLVAAHAAEFVEEAQLLSDRREGKYVVSYKTDGGWAGITKNILTEILEAGRDAKVVGLPHTAADALTLMCPNLVVLPEPS